MRITSGSSGSVNESGAALTTVETSLTAVMTGVNRARGSILDPSTRLTPREYLVGSRLDVPTH